MNREVSNSCHLTPHEKESLNMSIKCAEKTEVYSRVCGFFRPVQQWNKGKKEEFKERREYVVENR
jgi:anaerobic ribonucleoside-triphosphate reductase